MSEVVPGSPTDHPEHPGGKPGGALPRPRPVPLPGPRPVGRPGRPTRPQPLPHVDRDAPRRRRRHRRPGGARRPDGERRPGPWAGPRRRAPRACLDRGIEPVPGARAVELVVEDGRVAGVAFDGPTARSASAPRRGVVLATGGFEWDVELVRSFLRGPMTSPATIPTSTGDGLRMAMRVGAELGNMREAWWVPTIRIPGDELFGRQRAHLILRERTLPRSIMVNRPVVASPTRPPTTTPSEAPSTSSTPRSSPTPTCRAGWCSTTSTSSATGSPAGGPATRCPTT